MCFQQWPGYYDAAMFGFITRFGDQPEKVTEVSLLKQVAMMPGCISAMFDKE